MLALEWLRGRYDVPYVSRSLLPRAFARGYRQGRPAGAFQFSQAKIRLKVSTLGLNLTALLSPSHTLSRSHTTQ